MDGAIQHVDEHPEVFFSPEGPLVAVLVYRFPDEKNYRDVYANDGHKFSRIVAQKCTAEDADRIVACLTFCRGISTERLVRSLTGTPEKPVFDIALAIERYLALRSIAEINQGPEANTSVAENSQGGQDERPADGTNDPHYPSADASPADQA